MRNVELCAGKRGDGLPGWLQPLPRLCSRKRNTPEMVLCVTKVSGQGFKAICLCYDESVGFCFQISISENEYHYYKFVQMGSVFFFFSLFQSTKRNIPMLFVRGDGVVLVAPPLRVG